MSSIWSSLSGVRTHQFMLDVVGNNLANANTTGFKASAVSFADMMSQTLRPATAATENVGGKNPMQVGLGVQVGGVVRDFSQGGLQDTGNPLDLAVDGQGFIVLHDGTRMVFTRSSSFTVDANSNLVDSVTGYRLLNVDSESIRIPYDTQIPAQKTSLINMTGNLSADADIPMTESLASVSPFLSGGVAADGATELNAIDTLLAPYTDGDTIEISGTGANGSAITTAVFTYGAGNDGTTLGDLRDVVTSAFGGEATCDIDASGNLTLTATEDGDSALSVSLSNGGANGVDWSQHSFYVQTNGTDGSTRKTSIIFYDSLGKAHILTGTFQRVSEREWDMAAEMNDDSGVLTKNTISGVRFNTDGSFNSVSGGGADAQQILIDFGSSAEPQTIDIGLGTAGQFNGLTLFGGSASAAATHQDGFTAGTLKSISIGQDGMIQGIYTNGQLREISQLLVATFDNPEGLESLGQSVWSTTVNSGDPVLGTAMSGRAGSIASAVLEGSNVESAKELTKLIIAQYGFQLSTRAMAVGNRIIQELANVI